MFDHIHDSKKCSPSMDWEQVSQDACNKRKMTMQTFGILLPCDIDKFSGVEYVCCPDKIGNQIICVYNKFVCKIIQKKLLYVSRVPPKSL